VIPGPRETIAVTFIDYVFSFIVVTTAGNLISARRTKIGSGPFSVLATLIQFGIVGCGALIYALCHKMLQAPGAYMMSLGTAALAYLLSFGLAVSWIKRGRIGYLDRV
jgi:hypothetical protein